MTEHMNAEAVLRDARMRLENPEAWTRGALARKANGDNCNTRSEHAVSWCPLGAIFCTPTDGRTRNVAVRRLADVISDSTTYSIAAWSDALGRTHEEVLAAFDRAIADA